jgi:hypothetical protein
MSTAVKSRIYGLAFWAIVMAALASSLAWPGIGTENVATLAVVAINTFFIFGVLSLGHLLSDGKHEDADKRSKALKALSSIVATRDQRSALGRTWSVIQCVSLTVLSAYVGMLFGALLYAFLSMFIRLQHVAARDLAGPPVDAAQSPA